MSIATNSLSAAVAPTMGWEQALDDVVQGALAAGRMLVNLAGCAVLLLGAVVIGSDDVRVALKAVVPISTAAAESPAAPVPAVSEPVGNLAQVAAAADPQQKFVVQYLSRRYRVAEEATRLLVGTAFQIGQEQKLDPLLILSVMAIESSLNPFAESAMGAQGLMQVMTRIHAERFEPHGGQIAALDPVANMKVGSAILGDLISRGGSVERGLQLYVGAGNLPDDGGYGARVLGERARLALAATGKVDAAIAAGRAPALTEVKPAAADAALPAAKPAVTSHPAAAPAFSGEEAVPARSA
jgi:soluble lytic murein transglycosylase-like protein